MAGVPMSVSIQGLSCAVTHGPSGSLLQTTAPKDNGGTGASFSPTDLVGAALLSCALTTMALQAGREGLSWGDARGTVEKEMRSGPRRIAALTVVIDMPKETRAEHRARLEEVARGCPVARSLQADVQIPMIFRYP
jgi:putative redox protein